MLFSCEALETSPFISLHEIFFCNAVKSKKQNTFSLYCQNTEVVATF